MISTKSVKSTALVHLNGKWFWASVCSLIPFFCFAAVFVIVVVLSSVIGMFSLLVGIALSICVFKPVLFGSIRLFWLLANNNHESVSEAFYYFSCKKLYFKALKFSLLSFVIFAINFVLLYLPVLFLFSIASGIIFELLNMSIPTFGIGLESIGYIFSVIAFVIFIGRMLRYFSATFIFVSCEDVSPVEAVKLSVMVSKYAKGNYIVHICSFLGWILLSLFALPLIFTAPYLTMCYTVDCRYCVALYNREVYKFYKTPSYEV